MGSASHANWRRRRTRLSQNLQQANHLNDRQDVQLRQRSPVTTATTETPSPSRRDAPHIEPQGGTSAPQPEQSGAIARCRRSAGFN